MASNLYLPTSTYYHCQKEEERDREDIQIIMSQESTSPSRARRARKAVDYSIEQQFSDDDIFEDGPRSARDDHPPVTTSTTSRRKSRPSAKKSNVTSYSQQGGIGGGSGGYFDGGGSSNAMMSSSNAFERPKPMYTERGYDNTQLPLRQRFTFEPEYEDDGTPSIELIVGRRPIDDTKDRTTAATTTTTSSAGGDEAATTGDSDDKEEEENDEEEAPVTTTSSRRKTRKKKLAFALDNDTNVAAAATEEKNKEGGGNGLSEMDYEYLIKYKGRSYLHLEWKTAADLESMNTKAKTIYRRFLKKIELGTEEDLEDPTVDPSYTEPGRILAEEEHEIMVELSDKELVKWEKEQRRESENDEESEDSTDEEEGTEEKKKEEEEVGDGKLEKDVKDDPVGTCFC